MLIDRYNDAGDCVKIDEGDAAVLATWAAKGYVHEAKPEPKPEPKQATKHTPMSKKKFRNIKASDAPAAAQPMRNPEVE